MYGRLVLTGQQTFSPNLRKHLQQIVQYYYIFLHTNLHGQQSDSKILAASAPLPPISSEHSYCTLNSRSNAAKKRKLKPQKTELYNERKGKTNGGKLPNYNNMLRCNEAPHMSCSVERVGVYSLGLIYSTKLLILISLEGNENEPLHRSTWIAICAIPREVEIIKHGNFSLSIQYTYIHTRQAQFSMHAAQGERTEQLGKMLEQQTYLVHTVYRNTPHLLRVAGGFSSHGQVLGWPCAVRLLHHPGGRAQLFKVRLKVPVPPASQHRS